MSMVVAKYYLLTSPGSGGKGTEEPIEVMYLKIEFVTVIDCLHSTAILITCGWVKYRCYEWLLQHKRNFCVCYHELQIKGNVA